MTLKWLLYDDNNHHTSKDYKTGYLNV